MAMVRLASTPGKYTRTAAIAAPRRPSKGSLASPISVTGRYLRTLSRAASGEVVGCHFRLVRPSHGRAGDQDRFRGVPILRSHLDHPALAIGVTVGELGVGSKRFVDRDHLGVEGNLGRTNPLAGFDGGA